NGKPQPITYGEGKVHVYETSVFAFVKRYSLRRGIPPNGFFSCWKLGFSNYNIELDPQYRFVEKFTSNSLKIYNPEIMEIARYQKINLAWEAGKSERIFGDSFLLTFSFSIPLTITLYHSDNTLTKHFIRYSKDYIDKYKALSANLNLAYVL